MPFPIQCVWISILSASRIKRLRIGGWYLRGNVQCPLQAVWEEQSVHTLPSVGCWSLETAKLAARCSRSLFLHVLYPVTSAGAKTFAVVGWPRRQQYLLVDSRQEVVQCTCRVWILYKGKSSCEVLPECRMVLVAQTQPSSMGFVCKTLQVFLSGRPDLQSLSFGRHVLWILPSFYVTLLTHCLVLLWIGKFLSRISSEQKHGVPVRWPWFTSQMKSFFPSTLTEQQSFCGQWAPKLYSSKDQDLIGCNCTITIGQRFAVFFFKIEDCHGKWK